MKRIVRMCSSVLICFLVTFSAFAMDFFPVDSIEKKVYEKVKNREVGFIVLLDGSGSMTDCKISAVKLLNDYLKGLKDNSKKDVDLNIEINVFSSARYATLRNMQKIKDVGLIESSEYETSNSTPLYDSIAKTIKRYDDMKNIYFVIISDGKENASVEYGEIEIESLIEKKEKEDNWKIVFAGANQDPYETSGKLGIREGNVISFVTTASGFAELCNIISTDSACFLKKNTPDIVEGNVPVR